MSLTVTTSLSANKNCILLDNEVNEGDYFALSVFLKNAKQTLCVDPYADVYFEGEHLKELHDNLFNAKKVFESQREERWVSWIARAVDGKGKPIEGVKYYACKTTLLKTLECLISFVENALDEGLGVYFLGD